MDEEGVRRGPSVAFQQVLCKHSGVHNVGSSQTGEESKMSKV
jgi:hypothetical protein